MYSQQPSSQATFAHSGKIFHGYILHVKTKCKNIQLPLDMGWGDGEECLSLPTEASLTQSNTIQAPPQITKKGSASINLTCV